MTVVAVFAIRERGLLACGVVEGGAVHTGDEVIVSHGAEEFAAVCQGIEMIRFSEDSDIDRRTIGLLLPALNKDQIAEGDVVRSASTSVDAGTRLP